MPDAEIGSSRLVLTGPTGWIGRAMLARFAAISGEGWRDRVSLFGSSRRVEIGPDGGPIEIQALAELTSSVLDNAIVVHLAYLTKEKAEQQGERAFTDQNLAIDDLVLDRLASARPRSLFIASSGAAKLAAAGGDRHPYGMCKLRQEDRFLDWAARSGTPTLVGRIFNVAGPYINKVESYALGAFITQALDTQSISIAAPVPVFRSFLHVDDLCITVLRAGVRGVGRPTAVDLCGAEVLEMAHIASAVVARLRQPQIEITRGTVDWTRPNAYVGDFAETGSIVLQLGISLASFDRQIDDTIAWVRLGRSA